MNNMKKFLIKDLFDIRKGRKEKENNTNGIRYIQIEDIRNDNNIKLCEEHEKNILVNDDDIIIAWDGAHAGIVGFNLTGSLGSTLGRLRIKDDIEQSSVNTHYIGYYLKSLENYIKENTTGATIPHVSRTVLNRIEVLLPSIEVQNKVVEILDRLNDTKELRQQQIEALSALKQSIFLDMFGDPNSSDNKYPKERIGNLIEVQTGKTPSRKNLNYWNNGDVPWIKTTEVNNKRIESSSEFVTEEAVNESKLKLFPINTIFIAMYGQGKTRGQSALLTFPATCNQACAALLPNESMDELFLWNQLLLQYESLRSLGRGGNQPNLNLSLVRDFEILNPPLSLQQEYSNSIKRVDKIIEEIKNSYLYLEQLYNSLIHKAFNGELFKENKKA